MHTMLTFTSCNDTQAIEKCAWKECIIWTPNKYHHFGDNDKNYAEGKERFNGCMSMHSMDEKSTEGSNNPPTN